MSIAIMKGDKVAVHFGIKDYEVILGTVEYIPHTTGDCWIIKADDGTIYHVQTFAFIIRPVAIPVYSNGGPVTP